MPRAEAGRRRRLADLRNHARSVRARTSVVAVVVVGIALLVASVGLVIGLRYSLTNYLRTAAQLRAEDVADVLEDGEGPRDLAVDHDEEVFVQVLDADGRVVAASPNVRAEPPIASLADGESARVRDLDFEDDEFIVVAVEATTDEGQVTVLVGRNTEVIGESTGAVIRLLLLGVPTLLVVVGAATWRLTGRALAPVEEIRSEVEGISAAALSDRVSVPSTGDEVARLADTMNTMLARLEEAQVRQQRFVADASHELRSPVATIRQHAEVALAHPDRTTAADLAETVLAEDLRLQRLVEDLLWLARSDENVIVANARPVDVDDLVLDEMARLRTTTHLHVDSSGLSAGRVAGDANLLRMVVRNLLANAARHARTTIAVSLAEHGDETVLTVDDDGDGVPPEQRERVFERFVRLDDARSREEGGAGLGLSIVAAITSAHRGIVTVTDSPSGGARFEVRLPATAD